MNASRSRRLFGGVKKLAAVAALVAGGCSTTVVDKETNQKMEVPISVMMKLPKVLNDPEHNKLTKNEVESAKPFLRKIMQEALLAAGTCPPDKVDESVEAFFKEIVEDKNLPLER